MRSISSLFRRAQVVTTTVSVTTEIVRGQTYLLRGNDGDPFPRKDRTPVKILDVRSGWVRYSMGTMFTDERMEQRMFLRIYDRVS